MADAVQTFKSVCRGGLNTGADVLSLGEETPGSARPVSYTHLTLPTNREV